MLLLLLFSHVIPSFHSTRPFNSYLRVRCSKPTHTVQFLPRPFLLFSLIFFRSSSMSSLNNSPFGKRLRTSRSGALRDQDDGMDDHDMPCPPSPTPRGRNRGPVFGVPSLSADSQTPTARSSSPSRSPRRDYGDRYLPSRDQDIRTSYNLMEGPPNLYPISRMIPTESDAIKGEQDNTFPPSQFQEGHYTSIVHVLSFFLFFFFSSHNSDICMIFFSQIVF